MRTRLIIVSLAIALGAGGVAVWHAQHATAATDPKPPAPAPVPVAAEKVQLSDVPIVLTGIGTVTAYNVVQVHAQVTGTIDNIGFTEGQIVHPGSLIAQIDPRPFQAAHIDGRLTATRYSVHADRCRSKRIEQVGTDHRGRAGKAAAARRRDQRPATSDQRPAAPQLTLAINRDRASRLGITPAQIDNVLYDVFGRRPIAQLYTSLNQYYVIMEVPPAFQLGPNALQRIYVRSQTWCRSGLCDGGRPGGLPDPHTVRHAGCLHPHGQIAHLSFRRRALPHQQEAAPAE